MFSSSSFIVSYSTTDKVIRIVDTNSNITNTINVCRYQKSTVTNSYLNIYMEGNVSPYTLQFTDNADALLAIDFLKNAINTLKPNCVPTVTVSPYSATVTPISYLGFKSLYSSNTLVPLAWYDVTDTTSLFGPAPVTYRVQAISSADGYIRGKNQAGETYITINVATDSIVNFEDSVNGNFIINGGTLATSGSVTHCVVSNNSTLNATDSSYIVCDTGNAITCSNSSVVRFLNGCTMTVDNMTNVTFDDIQFGSPFPYALSAVLVNRSTSIGKNGKIVYTNLTGGAATKTFVSYVDCIDTEIAYTTNNNTVNLTLINPIPVAGGVFRIKLTGSGTNNEVNVYDALSTLLYTIFENENDNTVVFTYNPLTAKFEFTGVIQKQATLGKNVQFLTPSTAQVNFNLGTPVTQATQMEMYINGSKQTYGIDFYYDSGLGLAIYINTLFPIDSTEIVEFTVY